MVETSQAGPASLPDLGGPEDGAAAAPGSRRFGGATIIVLTVGLLITAAVTWTAWDLDHRTEQRLLRVQTQQAGTVLLAAIPSTQTPLTTAAQVAAATGGDPGQFVQLMTPLIGGKGQFTAASLWQVRGGVLTEVAHVGALVDPATAEALGTRALNAKTFVVSGQLSRKPPRLDYAYPRAGPDPRYVVFAEHTVPADRRSAVANNSAFADLHYAIFLGPTSSPAKLLTTSFQALPTSGTERITVPFGDTALTLVTAPAGQLGGSLPARLPWIFAVLGLLVTGFAAWVTQWLVRRRQEAEHDAAQIRGLYGRLDELYREQRTNAETLQRSLLPQANPEIPGMEIGVRYVPGPHGVDIGGDWYSVVTLDDTHFGFVIGDVSGHGIKAASVMAALRFTIRTLVVEGNSPAEVLEKCSTQVLSLIDGHIATVLVGIADLATHEVAVANAGHLNPLMISPDGSEFVTTKVGVPVGVPEAVYDTVTLSTPRRSTLLAFTDGLVERRGESLDVGLERLRQAIPGDGRPLDDLLTTVIETMTVESTDDDIAVLALRWLE